MSEQPGRGLPDSHLLPDAVVAFVDAELSPAAYERAAEHLARCPACKSEVAAQRQASTAVRGSESPVMSAGFLASLRAIPDDTDIAATSGLVGELAVSADGQLVTIQRATKAKGSVTESPSLDGSGDTASPRGLPGIDTRHVHQLWRRTAQGAGVVVSGVVLGAIVLVSTGDIGPASSQRPATPTRPPSNVLRVQFDLPGSTSPGSVSPKPSAVRGPGPGQSRRGTKPEDRGTPSPTVSTAAVPTAAVPTAAAPTAALTATSGQR